jgi:PAS domain-containing protein
MSRSYNPVIDVTKQVISQRRMSFLLRLGQLIANSQEPKDFWKQLLLGLQPDIPDLPFAIVYSAGSIVNETLSESSEQCGSLKKWVLEGTVRVGDHHTSIPDRLNSEEDLDGFLPDFMNLIKSNSPSILRVKDGSLPPSLAKDLKELGGEISCETALFLPIRSTTESALGFVILGINPRKAFDEDYKLFAELLSRQLTSSLVAAFLFEADRNRLSTKLALTTHENLELEARFRRMADLAPVGMFHLDTLGRLVYANERWFDLTELPRDPETMKASCRIAPCYFLLQLR